MDEFAFPSNGTMGEVICEGMTLRDYFAAKAMEALIITDRYTANQIPVMAFNMANDMLTERERRDG